MNSASVAKKNGIPPRTPTSIALWSHLLRKEPLPAPPNSEIDPLLAPLAPIDKNATSTRVLLYDTQGHLERFSIHVEKLCSTIEDVKREISTANTLFQSEHEKLAGDIIDLVNRSQMHILKAIAEPAQAAQLLQLTKDVDRRMETLEKRMDAMQAVIFRLVLDGRG
ncbi:hypothetical protein BDZ94DRAFT_1167480 [Collybia nuda]|uniref:Uncharacterized protein n=1 Tax=Collybia nuda TaxID=64659 RepID=A0A9P5Y3D4_9AGAR|nr:hypothetical protein BDZ94DRAFT_1167480 [Collybia nuda]